MATRYNRVKSDIVWCLRSEFTKRTFGVVVSDSPSPIRIILMHTWHDMFTPAVANHCVYVCVSYYSDTDIVGSPNSHLRKTTCLNNNSDIPPASGLFCMYLEVSLREASHVVAHIRPVNSFHAKTN